MNHTNQILRDIKYYFTESTYTKWVQIYKESLNNISHDEPWLTLVSLYTLFGDQQNLSSSNIINAFKELLTISGFKTNINVDKIEQISLEKILPEIKVYREYLYDLLKKGTFHLYPDRNKEMSKRLVGRKASLEGNTNLDAHIVFSYSGKKKYLFIEAKYLSDIDTKTSYNPVRNQIIRNIDAMIDFALNNEIPLEDVYFSMLTPKVFRTELYGGNKPFLLESFTPTRSRFYCFIMNEYRDYKNIKRDLPHRELSDKDWKLISERVGWITFDDIYNCAVKFNTITVYNQKFKEFFSERNL